MIDWRFFAAISLFLCAMTIIAFAQDVHPRQHPAVNENQYTQSPEKHWGEEDWADILQFYYPHDHQHGTWFNNYGKNCCGGKDCFPARAGTVKWTPDGYRVVLPDGGYAIVPEEKIKENPDDTTEMRATICLVRSSFMKHWESEGVSYTDTKYRIRSGCAWHGKPRI